MKAKGTFRRRVMTRLSWLGLTQADFAQVIGIDRATFSRALAVSLPKKAMLKRIAMGLGLELVVLRDGADLQLLLSEHPALIGQSLEHGDRLKYLKVWFKENYTEDPPRYRRTDEERYQRRMRVKQVMDENRFCPMVVRKLALQFEVSSSQIYADRTFWLNLQDKDS